MSHPVICKMLVNIGRGMGRKLLSAQFTCTFKTKINCVGGWGWASVKKGPHHIQRNSQTQTLKALTQKQVLEQERSLGSLLGKHDGHSGPISKSKEISERRMNIFQLGMSIDGELTTVTNHQATWAIWNHLQVRNINGIAYRFGMRTKKTTERERKGKSDMKIGNQRDT